MRAAVWDLSCPRRCGRRKRRSGPPELVPGVLVKRIPTTLLVVLFLGYATVFVRVPAAGLRLRPVFDPFEPRPRLVEQLIVARQYAKALPLAKRLRASFPNERQH